jgi:hypothetical protein
MLLLTEEKNEAAIKKSLRNKFNILPVKNMSEFLLL